MTEDSTVERDLLALINKARSEVARLQHEIHEWERRVASYTETLKDWRAEFGAVRSASGISSDAEFLRGIRKLSIREILRNWADANADEIIMRDVTHAAVEARLFKSREQAAGTLYATIGRMPEFAKVEKGIYHRKPAQLVDIAVTPQTPNDSSGDEPMILTRAEAKVASESPQHAGALPASVARYGPFSITDMSITGATRAGR